MLVARFHRVRSRRGGAAGHLQAVLPSSDCQRFLSRRHRLAPAIAGLDRNSISLQARGRQCSIRGNTLSLCPPRDRLTSLTYWNESASERQVRTEGLSRWRILVPGYHALAIYGTDDYLTEFWDLPSEAGRSSESVVRAERPERR